MVSMTAGRATEAFGRALIADGPAQEHAEELMLYGQFVGEWELDWIGMGQSAYGAYAADKSGRHRQDKMVDQPLREETRDDARPSLHHHTVNAQCT